MSRPEFEDLGYGTPNGEFSRYYYTPDWFSQGQRIARIFGRTTSLELAIELLPITQPLDCAESLGELLAPKQQCEAYGVLCLRNESKARTILDSLVSEVDVGYQVQ